MGGVRYGMDSPVLDCPANIVLLLLLLHFGNVVEFVAATRNGIDRPHSFELCSISSPSPRDDERSYDGLYSGCVGAIHPAPLASPVTAGSKLLLLRRYSRESTPFFLQLVCTKTQIHLQDRAIQNTDKHPPSIERGRHKTLGGLTARRGD